VAVELQKIKNQRLRKNNSQQNVEEKKSTTKSDSERKGATNIFEKGATKSSTSLTPIQKKSYAEAATAKKNVSCDESMSGILNIIIEKLIKQESLMTVFEKRLYQIERNQNQTSTKNK